MALTTFPAGETISKFSPVVVSSGGFLYKASPYNLSSARVTGISLDAGAPNDLIRVQTDDIISNFSGLTPGQNYYLGASSGTLASGYTAWAAQIADGFSTGAYFAPIGIAMTSTDFSVEIQEPIFVTTSGLL